MDFRNEQHGVSMLLYARRTMDRRTAFLEILIFLLTLSLGHIFLPACVYRAKRANKRFERDGK